MSTIPAHTAIESFDETSSRSAFPTCPVCRHAGLIDFFHLERLPIHVGVLHEIRDDALRAPTGTMTLAYCLNCGLAHNRRFEPEKLIFEPGYEVQLVHSAMFRTFLKQTADRLIERYDLHGKELIDIGCGAGHFLRMLCDRGGNRGLGVDPTLSSHHPGRDERGLDSHPASKPAASLDGRLQLVRDLFSQKYASLPRDFASCQSVLEDIPDPVTFIHWIRQMLEPRRGHAYLEVFNAMRAFEAGETWSLCYEQCNYYSLDSFVETIRRAGFQILEAGTCYGDSQYLYVEATPAADESGTRSSNAVTDLPDSLRQFGRLHEEKVARWWQRVDQYRAAGNRVVVWGSGGKGICFLNTIDALDVFSAVVDINPDRQGLYLPGTGQPIVAPQWLQANRPDVVVITNPLYEGEIRQTVADLGLSCDFVVI